MKACNCILGPEGCENCRNKSSNVSSTETINSIESYMVNPTRMAKWLPIRGNQFYQCSECNNVETIRKHFCSYCGARMINV